MKQKTKDHVEFGYFFSKDRINTWKNSPLQKLMPHAWGRGGKQWEGYIQGGWLSIAVLVCPYATVNY